MHSRYLVALVASLGIVGCGSASHRSSLTVRSSVVTVPFLTGPGSADTLRFVRLRIDGRPYLFLVDTGAGRTVVDTSVARGLRLQRLGPERRASTLGCGAASQAVRVADWDIAGRRLQPLTVVSQGLSDRLRIDGMRVSGLLGVDVLSRFGTVAIGYASQRLTLGGALSSGGRSVPFDVLRRSGSELVTVPVAANGLSTRWVVDTGAASTVVAASQIRRLGVRQVGAAQTAYGAAGCPTTVSPVRIDGWRAGDVKLPATVAISSASSLVSKPERTASVAGLIGSDVLGSFGSVTFDFTGRRIFFGDARS